VRRVLVFQHVAVEPLGSLLPLLRNYGLRIRYVNFERDPDARPNVEGYDGLIVLGGPMSAWDDATHPHLAREVESLRRALDREIPVLGICLGAQLLARALGAAVHPAPLPEVGWHEVSPTAAGQADPVLGGFEQTERLFQWHGDTFELPEDAVHLARGNGGAHSCANQAFRYGDRAYGLQFHLEANAQLIERWLRTPTHVSEIEARGEPLDVEAIRSATLTRIARSLRLSDETFGRFLDLWTERGRRSPHPHG